MQNIGRNSRTPDCLISAQVDNPKGKPSARTRLDGLHFQTPVGRFAPSPTGDLHFGSLLTALASYCDIKSRGGRWLLRIDDIDAPRSLAGSPDSIQRTLEAYGFEWDGPVLWQSKRHENYHHALSTLVKKQFIFACDCSRRSLPIGKPYPGKCRSNSIVKRQKNGLYPLHDHALRIRLHGDVSWQDEVQGKQTYNFDRQSGDAIIWRRDGLVSYALACAIDDSDNITHVVRGADLLESTGVQLGIMRALGYTYPSYSHIPVALDNNKDKLSKHSKAPAVSRKNVLKTLLQAWKYLGQDPFSPHTAPEFWHHAASIWNSQKIPKTLNQVVAT